jgi:hypothetical protein
MARIIAQTARETCNDKFIVLLSGGSNFWVAEQSIASIVAVLAGLTPPELGPDKFDENPEDIRVADNIINKLLKDLT